MPGVRSLPPPRAGYGELAQLSMVNVAVSLETLLAYLMVSRAAAGRGITVSGLYFESSTARVIEVTMDGIADIPR
ncbi:hypothetical protein [Nocardia vaccinii]|uniref:hypothetical protein n=1 Tax=Nocardia vaccinii TaxID=1822 RepID=UPI00082ED17A|nr:hypothetical protein [Nocardia vaccinii]